MKFTIGLLPDTLAICRLVRPAAIPDWAQGEFSFRLFGAGRAIDCGPPRDCSGRRSSRVGLMLPSNRR